jgi:hypothetical protein
MSGSTGDSPSPDEIERRIEKLEAELAKKAKKAKFTEPSAAERARQPVQPRLGWRAARKARKLREPVPEPAPRPWGSQPPPPSGGSRRGRTISLVITLAVIAGLAGGTVVVTRLRGLKAPRPDNVVVTNGPTPSRSPSPAPDTPPTPTLAAPFLGTPAQDYADGSAGIVIPPAHAVGSFSAADVAAAYHKTRKMLVAAYLNVPTLDGGAPDAFADLLTSQQRSQFVAGLDKIGLDAQGYAKSTRGWVISFPPGTTQLVGNVIKVQGTMKAKAAKDSDGNPILEVRTNYLFVYAVAEPGAPTSLMRIVAHQVNDVQFGTWDDPGGPLEPWWLASGGGVAGAMCGTKDGYQHPQFPGGPKGSVTPTGAPVDPYDQNAPTPKGCQATTGT